jgi:hypothetical protein
MSLQDLAADYQPTERPARQSLDPTQPTPEELQARAIAEQQARARTQAPQPVPPQQGPGIAFPRLSPTNPAQVAAINPAIPQVPGEPEQRPEDQTLTDPNKARPDKEATAEEGAPAEEAAPASDYNINPPAIYRPPPHRSPTQLGDDWFATKAAQSYPGVSPGPDMPSPQEAYPSALDANSQNARWGSKPVADAYSQANLLLSPLAAVADAFSKGRFSQNYSAAALRGLQIQQYEWLQKNQQANELHQEELSGVNRIAKMDQAGLISHEQARNMMRDFLHEHQHDSYIPILDLHGTAGVFKLYQIEDANWRRSHAAATTIKKALNVDGENAILRSWGIESGGDTEGMDTGRDTAAPTPAAGGARLQGELAPFNRLSEDQQSAAYSLFNGRGVPGMAELGKSGPRGAAAVADINQMARALDARANRIASYQDPKADADELSQRKLDALKQMNPEYGSTVEGLKNLTIDPKTEQAKNRLHTITQTGQIFPGWNQDSYNQFHTVWNNANSKESQQLQAANRATTSIIPFEKAVNGLPISETASWPARVWAELKTKGATSDPAYAALNEPLRTLATEVVFASGGRSQVTSVQQFLREAPLTGSKSALRTLARQSMIGVKGIVDQQTNTFHKNTGLGGRPPAFDERSDQIMDALVRSNPNTGAFPKDAPIELRSVAPSEAQRKQQRLTPDKSWEPLTREDYDKRKRYIEKNPNDPLIQLYMDELGIMQ